MAYIDVEIEMCDFDTNELIDELENRILSKQEQNQLLNILNRYSRISVDSLFSSTLLGEDVYNTLVELVKSKNELELLELFEKAK
jgi:hypothetical protein